MRKIVPIVIAIFALACGGDSNEPANGATTDGQGASQEGVPGGTPGSTPGAGAVALDPLTGEPTRVVAEVGDHEITLGQVNSLAQALGRNRPGTPQAELQKLALDNLVDQQVLVRAAEQRDISPTDQEFNQAVDQIASQFPSPEAFDQAIQQQGMTRAEFETNFRTEMTIRKFIEQAFVDTVTVTSEQARSYFEANPQEFASPEMVHARHILVRVDAGATPEADAAAMERAKQALSRIRAGEDFAKVAGEVSEDPSNAQQGGDLGFFPRGAMVPPFDEASFTLQPGQVSELVKTQFGYHIIRVEEKRPAGTLEFDQIAGQLIQNLQQQRVTEHIQSFLESEKTKLKIKREI